MLVIVEGFDTVGGTGAMNCLTGDGALGGSTTFGGGAGAAILA